MLRVRKMKENESVTAAYLAAMTSSKSGWLLGERAYPRRATTGKRRRKRPKTQTQRKLEKMLPCATTTAHAALPVAMNEEEPLVEGEVVEGEIVDMK